MFTGQLVESLESRRLMSGASVAHGVLRVYGDPTAHNVITVSNNTDGTSVDVKIVSATARHVTKTFTASFLKSIGFRKINIFGGIRADTIDVGLTNGSLGLKTRIDAFRGADTITTGSEADVIYAGLGNDTVVAGAGNDLVYGGGGDDNLAGGEGNDTVWGGNGNDLIDGGNGDDKLGGVLGANTLTGGAGHDTFVVKSLAANPNNDFNAAEDILVTRDKTSDVDAPAGVSA